MTSRTRIIGSKRRSRESSCVASPPQLGGAPVTCARKHVACSLSLRQAATHTNPNAHDEEDTTTIEAITDRKSTRLNSSHVAISYAVFCLKKKTKIISIIFISLSDVFISLTC